MNASAQGASVPTRENFFRHLGCGVSIVEQTVDRILRNRVVVSVQAPDLPGHGRKRVELDVNLSDVRQVQLAGVYWKKAQIEKQYAAPWSKLVPYEDLFANDQEYAMKILGTEIPSFWPNMLQDAMKCVLYEHADRSGWLDSENRKVQYPAPNDYVPFRHKVAHFVEKYGFRPPESWIDYDLQPFHQKFLEKFPVAITELSDLETTQTTDWGQERPEGAGWFMVAWLEIYQSSVLGQAGINHVILCKEQLFYSDERENHQGWPIGDSMTEFRLDDDAPAGVWMTPEETLEWHKGCTPEDLVRESGLASVEEGEEDGDFEMVGESQEVGAIRPPPPPLTPPPDLPTIAGGPVTPAPFPDGERVAVTESVGAAPTPGQAESSSDQLHLPNNRGPGQKEERCWCDPCSMWVMNSELGFHFESKEHKAAAEDYYPDEKNDYDGRPGDGSYDSDSWFDENWYHSGDYSWYDAGDAWSGYDWWSQSSDTSSWWNGSSGGSANHRSSR